MTARENVRLAAQAREPWHWRFLGGNAMFAAAGKHADIALERLGLAAVAGVPAGFLAVRIAMSRIPEFSEPTPVPLRYVPRTLLVAIFTAAFVLLLVVTSWIAGSATLRAAVAARLREAAQ